jgi:poly-gamma-glutamate synthesis protein (capsule biosynthesis protein)
MSGGRVSVYAVGDVFPDLPDGRSAFRHLTPFLRKADIVFGNCEGVYSDRPSKSPTHKHFGCAPRERGSMLGEVPFHVMTCANNHIIDGGYQGLADTLELLRSQGIAVTGAGMNVQQAIEPAIVERGGLSIGFLGFCSVFPRGYEARGERAGLAALRVRTHYDDPDPNFWEPGIDPLITTEPFPDDLRRFREAIAAAREKADFLVVACHWGYSSWVEVLQDYELRLAREAVGSGADAVVCHHHHSLRGVELHEGKPIYYGLGALVHHFSSFHLSGADRAARAARFGERSAWVDGEELPLFPFRADARKTGIATLHLSGDGTIEAGFVPALILADGSTEPLRSDDARAAEVAEYMERITAQSGFASEFERTDADGWMRLRLGPARDPAA